jgi:hypothetical protein
MSGLSAPKNFVVPIDTRSLEENACYGVPRMIPNSPMVLVPREKQGHGRPEGFDRRVG